MRKLNTGIYMLALLSMGFSSSLFARQVFDSLDIKIGQMIMIGVPHTSADSATLTSIREGKVGSVLLFEKNISPINAYIRLKKMIWSYQQAASIPLLVAIDQEGGRVNRLKEKYGFPHSISAFAMGESLDSVRFYGEIIGSTLAGLGITMNLAPVVDLAANPDNPVIAKLNRAFAAEGGAVAQFAEVFIKSHRRVGVLTALKHFPGHGSSDRDTHLGMADVTSTWTEHELQPYRTLIDKGYVDAIMTAHIVNRKLDTTGAPGTLSKNMIHDLLRQQLNYQGVVISDDMQMHAITQYVGFQASVLQAIRAGVDILVFSNNITTSKERTVDKVHATIRALVLDGTLSEERINRSFERIMKLKRRWAQMGSCPTK